tara:strand:- start:2484 stop:5021 length:2538 start_codon:yes stop_codon:yes gene_type:complete
MGTQISINDKVIYLSNDNVTIDQIKNSEHLQNKHGFDPKKAKIEILSGGGSEENTDLEEEGFFQSLKTKAGEIAKSVSDFVTAENRDPNILTIDELPVSHNMVLKDLKNQFGRPDSDATNIQDFYKQIFLEATSEDSAELAKERMTNINEQGNLKEQVLKTYSGEFDKKLKQLRLQLTVPMVDEKRKTAISNIHKDTKFGKDESGNMTITWKMPDEKGKMKDYTFYPNPTGLDQTDVLQASTAILATIPVTKAIKAIGLPVTGFTGGTLVGGTSGGVLGEAGVRSADIGGEGDEKIQRTIPQDVALGGFFGGTFQKGGEIILNLARAGLSKAGAIFSQNGSLRTEVRNALREMGYSSEEIAGIKGAVIKKMNELVTKQVEPQTASSFGMSQNLDVPIPLSRGQMSGNKAEQVFENQIEDGVFGNEGLGKTAMESLRNKQIDAIKANIGGSDSDGAVIGTMQERMASGNPVIKRGEGGEEIQQALVEAKKLEKAKANQLYDDARELDPVMVDYDDLSTMFNSVETSLKKSGFDKINSPQTTQYVEQLKDLDSLGEIFSLRQVLTKTAKDGQLSDKGASGEVINTIDDFLNNYINKKFAEDSTRVGSMELVSDSVKKWFTAIDNYKNFSQKWGGKNNILKVLTSKTGDRLDEDGKSVANKILSMSASNWSSKPNFYRALEDLKKALPEKEWNKIQQEAFIKIMDMGRTSKDNFSGATFSKKYDKLKDQAPNSMNILFGKEMLTRIDSFAKVAKQATDTAKNTSRSGSSLLYFMWASLGGQKLALVAPALNTQYKNIASLRGATKINYDKSMLDPKGIETNTTGGGLGGAFGVSREESNDPIINSPRF